jgi:PAS domain S-box-containing protein
MDMQDVTAHGPGATTQPTGPAMLADALNHLGPIAVMTALRDADDSIVDFRYEFVNPAFCEVLGEPEEALVGQQLLELYPSHAELGLFDAYCDVVNTGEPFVSELPWFDERNLRAFLEVKVVRFRDGYLLTGQDVTAAKMGEQVQRIFDQSRDGIISIDRDLRITAWNAGAEQLYGLSEHDAVGESLSVIVPEDVLATELRRLTEAMAQPDDVVTFEALRCHIDGTTRRVEVCATPIRGLDGEVVGASLIHRQLTQRDRNRSEPGDWAAPGAPEPPLDVEVWCRSTGKWVTGFRFEGFRPDGSVLLRRNTDRSALPESLPRDWVRPAAQRRPG